MRPSTLLFALPALASAQQIPFLDNVQPYLDKATTFAYSFLGQSATGGSNTTPHPAVTELKIANWEDTLRNRGKHGPGSIDNWLVYVTGNTTCGGECARPDAAWDEAVTLFADSPDTPNLALLDCDRQTALCGAWGAYASCVWYFRVSKPLPNQSRGPSAMTMHPLNYTTVTTSDITNIHTQKLYEKETPYEGWMHPLDGTLAKSGMMMPVAFALLFMSKVPAPVFMLGLSFFSRYFVNRRMPRDAPASGAPPAAAAPASAGTRKNQ